MTNHDVMNAIEEGMDVYDSNNSNMGSVLFLYMGGATGNINDDKLPSNAEEEVRKRLMQEGYIRIGNNIFPSGAYAPASDIDRIEDGRVYLNVQQNEVVRD